MSGKYSLMAKMGADTSNFKKGMRSVKSETAGLANQLKSLGGVMAGALSVGALVAFGKKSLELYNVQAQAEAKLTTALKGNIESFERLKILAGDLQKKTLFGDEKTIEAMSFLASMKLTESEIKKLMPLIQDFATLHQMDLSQAANLVAKSIGSSTNALSRYGIALDSSATMSEKVTSLMASLNEKVGGQAKAAAESGTGAAIQLTNAWGDFAEMVGSKLSPAFNEIAGMLKMITESMTGGSNYNPATNVDQKIKGAFDKKVEELKRLGLSMEEAQKQALDEFTSNIDKQKKKWESQINDLTNKKQGKSAWSQVMGSDDINKIYQQINLLTSSIISYDGALAKVSDQLQAVTRDTQAAIEAQNELNKALSARNAGNKAPSGLTPLQGPGNIDNAISPGKLNLKALTDPKFLNIYDSQALKIMEINQNIVSSFNAMNAELISSFAEGFGQMLSGTASMGDVMKGILNVFIDFMSQIGKMMIATAIASEAFQKSILGNPLLAIAAGATLIALAGALRGAMEKGPGAPALAAGGLAYGPTAAIVGDNPRANVDPEVIAPLSKLKGLMGNQGGGMVEFYIAGDRLKGVLNRYDKRINSMT